ncbi:hypothetical protein Tco_1341390, partial [Tanacetum coccineum]
ALQVLYVKDSVDKKLSIVIKTPPKNYKDTYDKVDEEFSTVIHYHNDNILPLVDRCDLANESRDDYYLKDCGEIIVVNLDSSSDNNNSDLYNTSQISTSKEIDYDSPEPPKRCNESDVKPSWKEMEKAKACMLAKAQASKASSKDKVEACGSKAKLQASTKGLSFVVLILVSLLTSFHRTAEFSLLADLWVIGFYLLADLWVIVLSLFLELAELGVSLLAELANLGVCLLAELAEFELFGLPYLKT